MSKRGLPSEDNSLDKSRSSRPQTTECAGPGSLSSANVQTSMPERLPPLSVDATASFGGDQASGPSSSPGATPSATPAKSFNIRDLLNPIQESDLQATSSNSSYSSNPYQRMQSSDPLRSSTTSANYPGPTSGHSFSAPINRDEGRASSNPSSLFPPSAALANTDERLDPPNAERENAIESKTCVNWARNSRECNGEEPCNRCSKDNAYCIYRIPLAIRLPLIGEVNCDRCYRQALKCSYPIKCMPPLFVSWN